MGKNLYVGNLGYAVTQSDLEQLFEPHGTVQSAQVVMDRDTGRSEGFGFVEMNTDQEAQAATTALNGQQSDGRDLTVREANLRPQREGRSGSVRSSWHPTVLSAVFVKEDWRRLASSGVVPGGDESGR